MAIEACGGTPDLGYVLGVSVYIRGFGVGNKSGGSPGCPQGRGRAQGVGAPPTLVGSPGLFWSKNKLRQVSGQLDSVWFSFSAILKNKEKTETGTGL